MEDADQVFMTDNPADAARKMINLTQRLASLDTTKLEQRLDSLKHELEQLVARLEQLEQDERARQYGDELERIEWDEHG